jgi:hypothetical protein
MSETIEQGGRHLGVAVLQASIYLEPRQWQSNKGDVLRE